MDAETREAVCGAAVKAAQAVNYEGAGTIEFIADASDGLKPDRIWFMEMNTRLQVEHPVTEMITSLDLVEWQLRVAAGEALPLTQDKIVRRGHAIEARLYAENPATGFLPSTGPLTHFELPQDVRVETGVEAGGAVTPYYDPMIAKIIAFGATREAAAAKLARACGQVAIWPVKTNAALLARALAHPDFVAGAVDTGFIDAHRGTLVPETSAPPETVLSAAGRAWLDAARAREPGAPWAALQGFRLNGSPALEVALQSDGRVHIIRPAAHDLRTAWHDGQLIVFGSGAAYRFSVPDIGGEAAVSTAGDGVIRSPMPGKIIAVQVKAGDEVRKGQTLIIVEAMKMEHVLMAPFDAMLTAVSAHVGDQVNEGETLARHEPRGE
jgi:acetyl/propionyl-CoA carboxylase alpha subunit